MIYGENLDKERQQTPRDGRWSHIIYTLFSI